MPLTWLSDMYDASSRRVGRRQVDVSREVGQLTRSLMPFLSACTTADMEGGSLGFGPDFATLVMSARIACD